MTQADWIPEKDNHLTINYFLKLFQLVWSVNEIFGETTIWNQEFSCFRSEVLF